MTNNSTKELPDSVTEALSEDQSSEPDPDMENVTVLTDNLPNI